MSSARSSEPVMRPRWFPVINRDDAGAHHAVKHMANRTANHTMKMHELVPAWHRVSPMLSTARAASPQPTPLASPGATDTSAWLVPWTL